MENSKAPHNCPCVKGIHRWLLESPHKVTVLRKSSCYCMPWTLMIPAIICKVLNNSLRPRRDRRHFADDIFKCVCLNENEWISLGISLKFVSKVRINNIPSLVQIMAWRRSGDKPLSEPMMVSLLTQICVTRPQWVKAGPQYCCLYTDHSDPSCRQCMSTHFSYPNKTT